MRHQECRRALCQEQAPCQAGRQPGDPLSPASGAARSTATVDAFCLTCRLIVVVELEGGPALDHSQLLPAVGQVAAVRGGGGREAFQKCDGAATTVWREGGIKPV